MQSSLSNTKFKVAFGAWWFTWAELQFIVLTKFGVLFYTALADSFICNLLLAATCLLISNNMKYYLPAKEKYWYVLIVSTVMSLLWLFISKYILEATFHKNASYLLLLDQSLLIRFCFAFLINGCMGMLSLLWYTQQEQSITDQRKADAERLSREAELFKLRQQLQPHFLFNSLNSISALTGTQPEKARHMIQQLSDFLRGTLRKDDNQWNSLKEEFEHLELYLDIEKVRFGNRLQTNMLHDENVLQMKIPSLLLQPVVENAIKFGLYDTIDDVVITIEATENNNTLVIEVKNPYDAETTQPLQGTGFGLSSIRRRLFLLFARKDLLQTKTVNGFFFTTIIIPHHNN